FHSPAMPDATALVMDAVAGEWATGARVWPQVQTRPIDISWTLDQRSIMFLVIPGWWQVLSLRTREEKLAAFTDPATRETLVNGLDMLSSMPGRSFDTADFVVRDVALERNRDLVGRSLGDIAAERGTSPAELLV